MPAVGRAPGVEEDLGVAGQAVDVERAVGLQENHQIRCCDRVC
jgi:hypothetical protein